ncbi:unnamed protein product [Fraxinus pennsylvanica]|uniref:Uncharacterized protein n=1 Tax=Fraxinus pennsylvanica TaxID=56036 RepID=A0AAD2E4H7_9LAMI|nr:unnamed protein product [Fraxinus pennsylvanica]
MQLTEFLESGNIKVNDFDALICSSGCEVYYHEDGEKPCPDPDYASHIDYRWGSDGLKKTIWKLMNTSVNDVKSGAVIEEDAKSSNCHCLSYLIKDSNKVNIVHLWYFLVRWRLNLANMYVILGKTGDTDYEELIAGTYKTIILKEVVEKGSEELLRTAGSYLRDDIVPKDSPLIAYVSGEAIAEEIANTLKQVSSSGM